MIFTINPIKQLRLLKNELSLEVSEMTEPTDGTGNQQPISNELEDNSVNHNRYKADGNSTDQNAS